MEKLTNFFGKIGKFWDFCRSHELDRHLEIPRKSQNLAAFLILGGRPGRFLVPYDWGPIR